MMTPIEQHRALSLFTTTCHEVLDSHMHHKSGWDQCDPSRLMTRVREELIEVEHELQRLGTGKFSLEALEHECADVANMIMMVYDVVKRLSGERQQ